MTSPYSDKRGWRRSRLPDYPTAIQDYDLCKSVGKGAFGEVFKAQLSHGERRGQKVAVKIIDKGLLNTPLRRRRIANEVSILSKLSHPSILQHLTSFEDERCVYLVSELCSMGSLYRYLADFPDGLEEDEARGVMKSLAQGVEYLHSKRIMHRDLKLSNVLLNSDMTVKIADFGLATRIDLREDDELTLCGTPNYISPEVIARQPYGLETDIWSLGCMFVCLLTGRPPFQSDQVQETLSLVSHGSYTLPKHLSHETKDLIKRLLQLDPKKRLPASQILQHHFFSPSLSILPLPELKESPKQYSWYSKKILPEKAEETFAKYVHPDRRKGLNTVIEEILDSRKLSEHSIKSLPIPEQTSPISKLRKPQNRFAKSPSERIFVTPAPPPPPRAFQGVETMLEEFEWQRDAPPVLERALSRRRGRENEGLSTVLSELEGLQGRKEKSTERVERRTSFDVKSSRHDHNPPNILSNLLARSPQKLPAPHSPVFKYRFTTTDIKPLTQRTKAGLIIVDENGIVLDLDDLNCSVSITGDGENVSVGRRRFPLDQLPAKYLYAYRYASKFISVIRAKTPKVTVDLPGGRVRVMLDGTFESRIQVKSHTILVRLSADSKFLKILVSDSLVWSGDPAFLPRKFLKIWSKTRNWRKQVLSLINASSEDEDNEDNEKDIANETTARYMENIGWCTLDSCNRWGLLFADGVRCKIDEKREKVVWVDSSGRKSVYEMNGMPRWVKERVGLLGEMKPLF
ncbi:Serine/threonine-protein kinase PLK4 [Neolecta irregularis DAH-3]|uniref:Serine/threonine-protein kinase PLK4 n=1 Tax=Neolecta irregularis (strain DAH-3) TaxID=1198029 RepID=A0A1U7LNZ5_NEOID|nr:Serine/threonine-protein kinase PLK4 [Neolecta irregularis DAH-3]|eukprot:OLL24386.1 Serine/threonine-protein kinase PLK4 [Neolecta irregularis DAH-3]